MSAGYGRGYYGSEQLAPPRRQSNSGWLTVAVVAGLGAVIWWWVLPAVGPKAKHAVTPAPSPVVPLTSHDDEISRQARERGFASAREYEDAVALMARDLRSTGAKVEMAPHLAHLEPRAGGTGTSEGTS